MIMFFFCFFCIQLRTVVSPSALFRSATDATRLVSAAMKHFGYSYLRNVLGPILEEELWMFTSKKLSYEIDPNKYVDVWPCCRVGAMQYMSHGCAFFLVHMCSTLPV